MNSVLRKFVARAPRYVLRPADRKSMRFSLQDTVGPAGIEETLLINLSETGVAFLTARGARVEVGELIKVEVPIPSGEQIAWWGRVVRVQEHHTRQWFSEDDFAEPARLLVAITFEDLPEAHSRALRKGIEQSFIKAVREQKYKTWNYYRAVLSQNFLRFTAYLVLIALAFGFLYYFSRPADNYDGSRGAPWGQRFKF